MNNIVEIAIIVGPIFLLMGVGAILRRLVRKELLWTRAEKLLVNIMLPILIIYVISDIRRVHDYHWALAQLVLAITVIAGLLAAGWMKMRGADRQAITAAMQGAAQHNIFIAASAVLFGFGFDGLKAAMFIASVLILVINIGNVLLAHFTGTVMNFKTALKKAILNPPVIASLISYFMISEYIHLPDSVNDPAGVIAQATLPFGLILAGAKLIGANGPLPWKQAAPFAAIKVIIVPALAAFMAPFLGVVGSGAFVGVALIFAVSPVTFNVYAEGSKADPALQMAILRLQTLGFILTLPFWLELTNYLQ
ncbi:MAG: hypothetical protein EYC62_06830 [Alphaproteobacteria bacterium]|nr:MAG: hypothetical protein EYC62_06830 [Alphaproteobacteria bacterium]